MAGIGVYQKSLRPTFVIALGIPISVIATFAALYFGKFTLNVMTLSGLALGVGMLVDNGIVVLENIFAHREKGSSLHESAVEGSTEVFIAITASTLTTMIVFLPLVFVNQEISLLYAGFSMSVILSLFFSLLVAVTLIPAVSARISFSTAGTELREPQGDYQKDLEWVLKRRRWISFSTAGTGLTGLQGYYQRILEWILKQRYWILGAVLLAFAASSWSLKARDKEFIGTTEQNKFTIFIELPTGAKLEVSDQMVAKVEAILKEIPEIKTASARVEKWSSKIYVELNPTVIRSKTTKQVIEEIRPKTDKLQPAFIYFEESEELGTKEVILDIFGHDYDVLRELAIAIARQMEQVPGLTDVKIRMREGRPELGLLIDKERAALFGLSVADIAETLHAEMRGLVATRYHTEAKEVETIARLQEQDRRTFDQLRKLVLSSPLYTGEGNQVYLEQVSKFDFRLGPSEIWRKNKNRMVQVSANIGAYPLSRAVEKISQAILGVAVPKEYFYQFGGNYEKLTQNQKEMTFAFIVTLILVYLVLASMFESYLQPFIIMTTVPMGAIGVAVALAIARKPIGIGVLMGGIMLAGIVVNNAIIFVDRVNALRKEKETASFFQFGLLVQAAKDRLRPILMTSSTTILGLIPMALDRSEAANLWSPLAITVIGGMISSTMLTLFLVPSLYLILEDGRKFLKKKVLSKS
jgi:HAE1 family hydrophobic/amphiphilic exporter-1